MINKSKSVFILNFVFFLSLFSFYNLTVADRTYAESLNLSKNLASLVAEFVALPNNPSASLELDLEEMNHNQVEKLEIQKQYLIGEIYKEAILEIKKPEDLHKLFLFGLYRGSGPRYGRFTLPELSRLTNPHTLFEIIFMLMQSKDAEIKILALEILKLQGIRYPSTDSFSRGLARYAAESVDEENRFDKLCTLFEELKALVKIHPHREGTPFEHYFISSIGFEIPYVFEQSEGSLKHKAAVKNLFAQIKKRQDHPSEFRGDLINALVRFTGEAEIENLIEEILASSTNYDDIYGVIMGLRGRRSFDALMLLYNHIDRLTTIPKRKPNDSTGVLEWAINGLTDSLNQEKGGFKELRTPVEKLFSHPHPAVRRSAMYGLRLSNFDEDKVVAHLLQFLKDSDESVRSAALGNIDIYMGNLAAQLIGPVTEVSLKDPSADNKDYAKSILEKLKARLAREQRSCNDSLEK